jgi:alpha,alpha-trehalase
MTSQIDEKAIEILKANDRGGFTVPTGRLYPYQWNWDSAFVALGIATFDRVRAWRELECLFAGQWPDGMIPHIIFRRSDPDYFPGPDVWQSNTTPPTSCHSQPPVLASIMARLVESGGEDDENQALLHFEQVLAWHRWFHAARDPDNRGVIGIMHPWESGRDNCPDWDEAMGNIVVDPDLPAYQRRDLDHVAAEQRPNQIDYDRFLTIVKFGVDCGWDQKTIARDGPFFVADPGTMFILQRADRDLLKLAQRFGKADAAAEIQGWIELGEAGAQTLWNEEAGGFCARNLRTGKLSTGISNASMLAFHAGVGTPEQTARLAREVERILSRVKFGMPSWDPDHSGFEPKRYWRGPVWAMMNFLIADGLGEAGYGELSGRVRRDTAALIEQSGFFEYFDPLTGRGYGGGDFSWTAAIWLAWASPDGVAQAA